MNVISSPLTDDESTESIDKVAPDIDPLSVHSFYIRSLCLQFVFKR